MAILERLNLTKADVEKIEQTISQQRQVERYCMLRQWCYGRVLDFGCGCGYGSWIISRNPDVKFVKGYDIDIPTLDWARNNFTNPNLEYSNKAEETFDVVLAIEVIEHIEDKHFLPSFILKTKAKEVIISYPSRKTTHYNKFHYYDYTTQEILDLFPEYFLFKEMNYREESNILHLQREGHSSVK